MMLKREILLKNSKNKIPKFLKPNKLRKIKEYKDLDNTSKVSRKLLQEIKEGEINIKID